MDTKKIKQDRFKVIDSWKKQRKRQGLVGTGTWDSEKPDFFWEDVFNNVKAPLYDSDIIFFIVDVRNGITTVDFEISQWIKQNVVQTDFLDTNDQEKEIVPGEGLGKKKDDKIYVKKVVLIANKCDEGELFGQENELYQLGLGDPVCVAAETGEGMHELWEVIDESVPEESQIWFKERAKKRKKRYKELKKQLKTDLENELQSNKNVNFDQYDIREWLYEFDLVNENPEDNSDFDSDSEINPEKYMNTEIVMEHQGVSSENYLKNRKINLSIIGRPNAGKSSLVNTFLENDKVLASDVSHTTTDTTSHMFTHNDVKLNLIDTAGIEKSTKKKKNVQQLIFRKTMRAIKGSQCVIVMIDALEAFRNIDFDLVNLCVREGRPVVLVVNKWDLVDEKWKERAAKFMKNQVDKSLGILNNVPVHFISATSGMRVKRVLDSVLDVYTGWNKRISTGLLNNWLDRFKRVQKMPTKGEQKLKIFYIAQIKSRPPTFTVFVNDIKMVDENYTKFIKKNFTQEFGLEGVPIRIVYRGIQYKELKKQIAKGFADEFGSVGQEKSALRKILLKRRRMKTFAKIKLNEVNNQY